MKAADFNVHIYHSFFTQTLQDVTLNFYHAELLLAELLLLALDVV